MAPDKKEKKRKAVSAVASDPPSKKTKKVEVNPVEVAKTDAKPALKKKVPSVTAKTANGSDSALKLNGEPARQIKPRKRAADFLSDASDDEGVKVKAAKQLNLDKSKPQNKKAKAKKIEDEVVAPTEAKLKSTKSAQVATPDSDENSSFGGVSDSDEGDSDGANEDDQTAALIKGFESSGDEDASGDEGFDPDQPVPRIPDSKKTKRKILKKQKKNMEANEETGTVYVGRIPHGFYEHQMRAYFSQFGEITRLRLSRNRITGRSKHYAFIEFSSVSVAKIVAETMDNYLMYGHILKCKFVPREQLHPEIWKGANRRFKKTPWNRIEKKRLERGKTREQWSKSIGQEQKRRRAKAEKLKALGYEFELPQLKSIQDVPVQEPPKAIEAVDQSPEQPAAPKAIEEGVAKENQVEEEADATPKKSKKGTKAGKTKETGEDTPKQDAVKVAAKATTAVVSASPATKGKKEKSKTKSKSKA